MNKAWSRAFQAAGFVVASTLTAACAADATGSDPTAPAGSSEPSSVAAGTKQSVESVHVHIAATASECPQNACCLLARPPGGYPDDPLENALTALGCDAPAAYSDGKTGSGSWLYVQCPATFQLLWDVERYSRAPYYARFSASTCLWPVLKPGHLVVEFDPTCDSCVASPPAAF